MASVRLSSIVSFFLRGFTASMVIYATTYYTPKFNQNENSVEMDLTLDSPISFIACNEGPAAHFAVYAQKLAESGNRVKIHAIGDAWCKLEKCQVYAKKKYSLDALSSDKEDDLLAEQIAKDCAGSLVVTDVGHLFDIKLQKALEKEGIAHFAYYDNSENWVPDYSITAAEVMLNSQGVLFANANLVDSELYMTPKEKIDLGARKRMGVGYYPKEESARIADKRKVDGDRYRAELLVKLDLEDNGQKIIVYFGGNNSVYFGLALPAFLHILEKSSEKRNNSNLIIVFHQHPSAKKLNLEQQLLEEISKSSHFPICTMSSFTTSSEVEVVAQLALYYQTSLSAQFVLAGIPTAQVAHRAFQDLLVRGGLCRSVTEYEQFDALIDGLIAGKLEGVDLEKIDRGLGFHSDWLQRLFNALKIFECETQRK